MVLIRDLEIERVNEVGQKRGSAHYALHKTVKRPRDGEIIKQKWLVRTKEMACKHIVGFPKTAELRNLGKRLYKRSLGALYKENWKTQINKN